MYQRALKLQEIITSVTLFLDHGEEQLDSYSIAINALSLVEENGQWITLPIVKDSVSQFKFFIKTSLILKCRAKNARRCQDTSQNPVSKRPNTMPPLSTLQIFARVIPCSPPKSTSSSVNQTSSLPPVRPFLGLQWKAHSTLRVRVPSSAARHCDASGPPQPT